MSVLERLTHVGQGEYAASADPAVTYSTILGSCVSTCLFDDTAKVGGLNHIVLPNETNSDPFDLLNQVNAMECLINALLKLGARRSNLVAKLFGGANMLGASGKVGDRNARFVLDFCADEGIPIIGQSLGGTQARRLRYTPSSGRVQVKLVRDAMRLEEARPKAAVDAAIELFD